MITNGTVKYGETVKTGDFENKRVDVELSFKVEEDSDPDHIIAHVGATAHHHAQTMLGRKTAAKSAPAETAEPAKTTTKRAPKAPAAETAEPAKKVVDASAVEEPMETPAFLKGKMLDPATGKPAADPAAVDEENLDDLLGGGEAVKEITDKELTDATQQCQARAKNAPAIRKALGEVGVKSPPGRLIDIEQGKRAEYLEKLKAIQPLA